MNKSRKTRSNRPYSFESVGLKIIPNQGLPMIFQGFSFNLRRVFRINIKPRVASTKWISNWTSRIALADLASAFGLDVSSCKDVLKNHDKRLDQRSFVALVGSAPFFFLPLLLLGLLLTRLSLESDVESVLSILLFIPFQLAIVKLAFLYIDKFYADSLCICSSLGVLVELVDSNVLKDPRSRRMLLTFIDEVARNISLLHLCFRSSSEYQRELTKKQFQKMERYIREQEHQAILPSDCSLENLRQNFLMLTNIFITSQYGDFTWQEASSESITVPEGVAWQRQPVIWIGRILAVGVPSVALYFIVSRPEVFASFPVDRNFLLLLVFAWLFLSIDSVFRIGVMANTISLTKELKELF
jgi:hypothetical protein